MNSAEAPERRAEGGLTAVIAWAVYASGSLFAAFEVITIHSVLVKDPAVGAMQGLGVFALVTFGLTRLLRAPRKRAIVLARVAVLASALAVPLTFVLQTRMVEAGGAVPDPVRVAQMVIFLLFQTGWAVTHWLTTEKRRTGQARYIPAAVGAVIFIVGGLMTNGAEASESRSARAEPAEAGEVYKTFATAEDYAFAEETQRLGEESGSAFAHVHTGREPMLGVAFSTQDWFGRERIGSDFKGVFDRGAASERTHRIVARPGYAVAALEVQADDHINAVRVQFAPFDGSRLSFDDRYWSEWAGSHQLNGRTTILDSGAALVVGFRGTSGMVLNSLSLLIALLGE